MTSRAFPSLCDVELLHREPASRGPPSVSGVSEAQSSVGRHGWIHVSDARGRSPLRHPWTPQRLRLPVAPLLCRQGPSAATREPPIFDVDRPDWTPSGNVCAFKWWTARIALSRPEPCRVPLLQSSSPAGHATRTHGRLRKDRSRSLCDADPGRTVRGPFPPVQPRVWRHPELRRPHEFTPSRHSSRFRNVLSISSAKRHQTGTVLPLGRTKGRLRTADSVQQGVHDDARTGNAHQCGTRWRTGTDELHLSVGELLSRTETVQGQVQTRQPHPCSHRRKTVSMPVSWMWKSLRQERKLKNTQTNSHR